MDTQTSRTSDVSPAIPRKARHYIADPAPPPPRPQANDGDRFEINARSSKLPGGPVAVALIKLSHLTGGVATRRDFKVLAAGSNGTVEVDTNWLTDIRVLKPLDSCPESKRVPPDPRDVVGSVLKRFDGDDAQQIAALAQLVAGASSVNHRRSPDVSADYIEEARRQVSEVESGNLDALLKMSRSRKAPEVADLALTLLEKLPQELSDDALPALVTLGEMLKSEDKDRRRMGIRYLVRLPKTGDVVKAIVAAMTHADSSVSTVASDWLARSLPAGTSRRKA